MSLLSNYLFVTCNRAAWGVGMLTVPINIALYKSKGLYGQVSLEVICFCFILYGWYVWKYRKDGEKTRFIRRASPSLLLLIASVGALGIGTIGTLLLYFTNTLTPWWDASIILLGLTAQWLLCQKILECWIFFFLLDAAVVSLSLSKGIVFVKGVAFHTGLYTFYLLIAIAGYYRWRSLWSQQQSMHSQ